VGTAGWLIVKATLAAGAICGLAGAALETFRVLRDHVENVEGNSSS
jgi:hypothetical protein